MKKISTIAAFLTASACTSLSPIPLAPLSALTCPQNPSGQAKELCDALAGPVSSASLYKGRYESIAFERLMLDTTLIGATVAGAGFGLFGAHPDNVTAAALTTGAVGVLRGGLKQTEQLKYLRNGYASMSCFLGEGSSMLSIYLNTDISRANIIGAKTELRNAIDDASSAPAATTPADMRLAAFISEELPRARQLLETAEQASNAYSDFTQNLRKSYVDAVANVESRTDGLDINPAILASRIAEAATELAKKSAQPSTPKTSGQTGGDTLATIAENLRIGTEGVEDMLPGQIVKAYNGLSVCLARSAA